MGSVRETSETVRNEYLALSVTHRCKNALKVDACAAPPNSRFDQVTLHVSRNFPDASGKIVGTNSVATVADKSVSSRVVISRKPVALGPSVSEM